MQQIKARSDKASSVFTLLEELQQRFVSGLEANLEQGSKFEKLSWLRDEGSHGGGAVISLAIKSILTVPA
ncbi:hypothetical protein [Dongshaea marina]|uniref:hypothetical protein n=1 Tax=Dongshaea marina TaxID=2047966 RepID=UPI001900BE76|nr:hypothetical protein [Dongshaea marina]